jgi:DNA polymerase III gamma/tau subunit
VVTHISEEDVTSSLGLVSVATLAQFAETIAQQQTREAASTLVEEIYSRGYDARQLHSRADGLSSATSSSSDPASRRAGCSAITEVEIVRLKELAPLFSEADLVRGFQFTLAATEKEIKDSPQPRYPA